MKLRAAVAAMVCAVIVTLGLLFFLASGQTGNDGCIYAFKDRSGPSTAYVLEEGALVAAPPKQCKRYSNLQKYRQDTVGGSASQERKAPVVSGDDGAQLWRMVDALVAFAFVVGLVVLMIVMIAFGTYFLKFRKLVMETIGLEKPSVSSEIQKALDGQGATLDSVKADVADVVKRVGDLAAAAGGAPQHEEILQRFQAHAEKLPQEFLRVLEDAAEGALAAFNRLLSAFAQAAPAATGEAASDELAEGESLIASEKEHDPAEDHAVTPGLNGEIRRTIILLSKYIGEISTQLTALGDERKEFENSVNQRFDRLEGDVSKRLAEVQGQLGKLSERDGKKDEERDAQLRDFIRDIKALPQVLMNLLGKQDAEHKSGNLDAAPEPPPPPAISPPPPGLRPEREFPTALAELLQTMFDERFDIDKQLQANREILTRGLDFAHRDLWPSGIAPGFVLRIMRTLRVLDLKLAVLDSKSQEEQLNAFVRGFLGGKAHVFLPKPGEKIDNVRIVRARLPTGGYTNEVASAVWPGLVFSETVLLSAGALDLA